MNVPDPDQPLLSVEGLTLAAPLLGIEAVDDLWFRIERGEFLAVVGESGSGTTMAARAMLALLPPGIGPTGGCIRLDGEALVPAPQARMRGLRGAAIGKIGRPHVET